MNKTGKATLALVLLIPFGVVMVYDPKEVADNPHTHNEAPSLPIVDCLAPMVATVTARPMLVPPGIAGQFEGSAFRVVI
jgi:hypothetical protein